MKRQFIIGKTLDLALQKYPIETTVHEIENPFNLDSSELELKLIFGILAHKAKSDRELTQTESKHLKWVQRMYPDLLKYRFFGVAIKFTNEEKSEFIEYMKEIYEKDSVNLSNIYRVFTFV
tara:strand:+ start:121 stop:483 length:363 start_codon:yes stop_codon:yes gene_type:complete